MTARKDDNRQRSVWSRIASTLGLAPQQDGTATTARSSAPQSSGTPSRRRKAAIAVSIALGLTAAAGFGGTYYVKANTVSYYHLYKDGTELGTVDSPEAVEELLALKKEEAARENPGVDMELETGSLTYEPASGFKAVPDTEATLDKLEKQIAFYAVGVEIKVEGEVIGVVKDKATAERVLQRVQGEYAPELVMPEVMNVRPMSYNANGKAADSSPESASQKSVSPKPNREVKQVKFVEDVDTQSAKVQPAEIVDEETMYKTIVSGTEAETTYTVQPGDCVGCIAEKFDIDKQVIYDNNPWIKNDMIKVGDVLDLTVREPKINVETVERLTKTVETKPDYVVRENDEMRVGESKVISEGIKGISELTYKQVKRNGVLVSSELVSTVVIKPSSPKIVMKGTKVVRGEGTGDFEYPVSGATLTSKFGKRWGRLHKGIDLVGDSTIKAADEGVVEFAGVKSGYGNVVIINHRNGYKTLYAHLSSYSVAEGEIVEKGDPIGIMGNTGRSFGTHLHFEIHKNGAVQNPLDYL